MRFSYCPHCMTPIQPNSTCPNCGLTPDSYQPEAHQLPPGTLLADRYLLGKVLGEGGFGITYIGIDTRLDLRVAVKEYFPSTQVTRDCTVSHAVRRYTNSAARDFTPGLEHFIQEARALARMDKIPEIVAVRDFFEENGTAYIVMEYVDGTTFKELVAQNGGPLPADQVLSMIRPLFGALNTLHKQKLIHRDISPDNLMLENGKVRLLDFGCARESLSGSETMTVMLKQGFSPIEQYQYKGQGPWTDVYSLAATIYYCITGTVPPQSLDRLIDEELVPPTKLGADLTQQQEQALLYGMGLQPTRRFRSVEEFYASLYENVPVPIRTRGRTRSAAARIAAASAAPVQEEETNLQSAGEEQENGQEKPHTEKPPKNTENTAESAQDGGSEVQTVQDSTERKPEKPSRGIKKCFLWGSAAVVLVIGIWFAVSHIGNAQPSAESAPPDSSQAAETLPPSLSAEPLHSEIPGTAAPSSPAPLPAGTVVLDTDTFLAALEDDTAEAIQVASGAAVEISDPLEITKPIYLESGCHLLCSAPITLQADLVAGDGAEIRCSSDLTIAAEFRVPSNATVSLSGKNITVTKDGTLYVEQAGSLGTPDCRTLTVDGGRLYLEGFFSNNNLVHTQSGGTIEIPDSGLAELSLLWLQTPNDIIGSDRLRLVDNNLITLDDTVSDSVLSVHTQQELEDALNNPLALAIRIDDSIHLDHDLTVATPLILSENCTLSAAPESQVRLILSDLLVNRGELQGCTLEVTGGSCINYGTAAVSLFSREGGTLVNLGSLTLGNTDWERARTVNLGAIQVGTPDGEAAFAALIGGNLWNLQDSTITVTPHNTLDFNLGLCFYSAGTLTVEQDAQLINNALLDGDLVLAGTIQNEGGVLGFRSSEIQGGDIIGGLVVTTKAQEDHYAGVSAPVLVMNAHHEGIEVSDAETFLQVMKEGTSGIRVSGDIVIDQPVELEHSLTIESEASLTIHGSLLLKNGATLSVPGLLTVDELQMQDSYLIAGPTPAFQILSRGILIANGGSITLNHTNAEVYGPIRAEQPGSQLRLENGSLLFNQSEILGFNITIADAHLSNSAMVEIPDSGSLTLQNGTFNNFSDFSMQNGALTIDTGSKLSSSSPIHLANCNFSNSGVVYLREGDFYADPEHKISNSGYMEIGTFWNGNTFLLNGAIENRGTLAIRCFSTVNHIDNFGELLVRDGTTLTISDAMHNNGTFALENGDYTGTVYGNPVENRQ